jgi:hypothetical protein
MGSHPTDTQIQLAKKVNKRLNKNPKTEGEIRENVMLIARFGKNQFTAGWFEGLCRRSNLLREDNKKIEEEEK